MCSLALYRCFDHGETKCRKTRSASWSGSGSARNQGAGTRQLAQGVGSETEKAARNGYTYRRDHWLHRHPAALFHALRCYCSRKCATRRRFPQASRFPPCMVAIAILTALCAPCFLPQGWATVGPRARPRLGDWPNRETADDDGNSCVTTRTSISDV